MSLNLNKTADIEGEERQLNWRDVSFPVSTNRVTVLLSRRLKDLTKSLANYVLLYLQYLFWVGDSIHIVTYSNSHFSNTTQGVGSYF